MSSEAIDWAHRDQVLRAYILGRDWEPEDSEFSLVRYLVERSAELLPEFPLLVAYEWWVGNGTGFSGKGDLVFFDGHSRFVVVEVKDIEGSGGRNRRRNQVEEQAENYREQWQSRFPGTSVCAMVYTRDDSFGGLRVPSERAPGSGVPPARHGLVTFDDLPDWDL
jgi:hypothetical protein